MKLINRIKRAYIHFKARYYRKPDIISIAVISDGGVGDGIVNLNYIKHLRDWAGNVEIDFYFKPKVVEQIYSPDEGYLRGYFPKDDAIVRQAQYDLVLRMKERFPYVVCVSRKRLMKLNPMLFNLVDFYKEYYERFRFYYDCSPRSDGFSAILSVIQGGNRVTQPDVGGKLSIKGISIRIPVKEEEATLQKYGLRSGKFITFNRSVDTANGHWESTKLWPKSSYVELWELLQQSHPDLQLVYIGPQPEDFVPPGVLNLSGQTTFDELKILLSNSRLHIGPEGGMVHLRHALKGGRSCVLFGPTSIAFYGYTENINLETDICASQCE